MAEFSHHINIWEDVTRAGVGAVGERAAVLGEGTRKGPPFPDSLVNPGSVGPQQGEGGLQGTEGARS